MTKRTAKVILFLLSKIFFLLFCKKYFEVDFTPEKVDFNVLFFEIKIVCVEGAFTLVLLLCNI